jgi:hypothetical protein
MPGPAPGIRIEGSASGATVIVEPDGCARLAEMIDGVVPFDRRRGAEAPELKLIWLSSGPHAC